MVQLIFLSIPQKYRLIPNRPVLHGQAFLWHILTCLTPRVAPGAIQYLTPFWGHARLKVLSRGRIGKE